MVSLSLNTTEYYVMKALRKLSLLVLTDKVHYLYVAIATDTGPPLRPECSDQLSGPAWPGLGHSSGSARPRQLSQDSHVTLSHTGDNTP